MVYKILVVGDPHYKVNNVKETSVLEELVLSKVSELSPDFLVIFGDTLHTHERINSESLTRAINFLYSVSKKTQLCLLIGNHYLVNNKVYLGGTHPFSACHHWDTNPLSPILQRYYPCGGTTSCLYPTFQRGDS